MGKLPQQLQNHESKCRCCFTLLEPSQKTVNISKSIANRFNVLTNIKLIVSDLYSKVICEGCNSKLSEFADFQSELVENQTILYEHIFEAKSEVTREETEIKELFVEYIEDEQLNDGLINVAVKEEPQFHYRISIENDSPIKEETAKSPEEHKPRHQWHCVTCDIKFETKALLLSHRRSHRQPKEKKSRRKICQICGMSFAANGWYHHVLRAHTEDFRFLCDFCGKGFRIKNDLKDHLNTHISIESRRKFECSFCDSTLLSKNALKNHFQTFHSEVIEEHPCDCGKIFSSRMKLVQHKLTVHYKEKVNCPDCGKTFTSKDTLRKHTNMHHKQKEPCNICGKMYTPGMFMKMHKKSHDPPQFKCEVEGCNKIFHRSTQLHYHTNVDHNPVDIACNTCGATFNGSRNLSRHIKRQHSSLRVECAVEGCKHLAARKDYLSAHYRAHKDINEETRKLLLEQVKDIKGIPW